MIATRLSNNALEQQVAIPIISSASSSLEIESTRDGKKSLVLTFSWKSFNAVRN
jgi:hypothetical protein